MTAPCDPASAHAFEMAMYSFIVLGVVGWIKWIYDHTRAYLATLKGDSEE